MPEGKTQKRALKTFGGRQGGLLAWTKDPASIGLARAQMDPKEAQEAARKALQRDMKAKAAKAKAAKANAEKAAAAAAAAAATAAESAAAEQQQLLHSLRKD